MKSGFTKITKVFSKLATSVSSQKGTTVQRFSHGKSPRSAAEVNVDLLEFHKSKGAAGNAKSKQDLDLASLQVMAALSALQNEK
jgi:hypothetical protein